MRPFPNNLIKRYVITRLTGSVGSEGYFRISTSEGKGVKYEV